MSAIKLWAGVISAWMLLSGAGFAQLDLSLGVLTC